MRIGIDARLWDQTGVGRYIRNLCINLQRIDKKNDYVIIVRSNDLENVKKKINSPKWKVIVSDIRWHSFSEQISFSKILLSEKLDLVHFPYFSLPIFYPKNYVVTIHDLIINHYPTGKASTLFPIFYYIKLLFYKFIIYMGAKNSVGIIAPSNATKKEILDHLKVEDKKVTVTYEACDEDIQSENKKEKTNNISGKYFLYVGNAYPHKNLENLLKAFKKINEEVKDLKLVLVGNKDYFYNNLEKKVKSMNLSNVIFYGKASDSELSYLYKNALGLVMPSLMEGFGLPVLEAMNNKCLVVCSNIPSLKEIVKDNALYFSPTDINDIKLKLENAYFKKYDIGILEKAYSDSKKFSWENTAKETLKVYESSFSLRQG
jgi:glycosyltransferase involved in cell wall biosynthesis